MTLRHLPAPVRLAWMLEDPEPIRQVEYIILVAEDVGLDAAMHHLQTYEAAVLQDLKRGRYPISLRQSPGIDQLKGEVDATSDIVLIQPNYTCTTQ